MTVDFADIHLTDLRGDRRFNVGVAVIRKPAQVAANFGAEVSKADECHDTFIILVVRCYAVPVQRDDADDHRWTRP